jgi:hypothetical protein
LALPTSDQVGKSVVLTLGAQRSTKKRKMITSGYCLYICSMVTISSTDVSNKIVNGIKKIKELVSRIYKSSLEQTDKYFVVYVKLIYL